MTICREHARLPHARRFGQTRVVHTSRGPVQRTAVFLARKGWAARMTGLGCLPLRVLDPGKRICRKMLLPDGIFQCRVEDPPTSPVVLASGGGPVELRGACIQRTADRTLLAARPSARSSLPTTAARNQSPAAWPYRGVRSRKVGRDRHARREVEVSRRASPAASRRSAGQTGGETPAGSGPRRPPRQ
jgi:hypothetical protein